MGNGAKIGLRVLMYYGLMLLISLLFLSSMTGWVLYVLNALLAAGFIAIVFNDGGYEGEKAATMRAMVEKQREEGHVIDPVWVKQSFDKKHVAGILLVSALPLFLIAAANLACEPLYPEIPMVSAADVAEDMEEPDAEFAYDEGAFPEADIDIADAAEEEQTSPAIGLMVVTRALFMPFVALYSLVRAHVLYILFLPLSFVLPMASVVGYLQGPKLRVKKLKDIERGKKRKLRNMRANKKPKEPRQIKPEV